MRTFSFAITSLVMIGMLGCTTDNLPKTVPAEGVVLLDGVPVSDATIVLIADVGNNNASAVSDKDGKFQLKAFETKPGVVPGSYKVQISKTINEASSEKGGESNVNLKYGLPIKYSLFTSSGLTTTVGEQGTKDIKYELKSK